MKQVAMASMQNFSKIKVTITIIRSFYSKSKVECPSKKSRETKLKHQHNMYKTWHNPRGLSDAHHLECCICKLMLVMPRYCHNELCSTLLSAHITTNEYVAHYITSLFQKVILVTTKRVTSLRNALY